MSPAANTAVTTVDEFLAAFPKDKRDTLEKLRRTIQAAAPKAEETITYGVAGFKYCGRPLVSFAAGKNHCSLYVMSPAVMRAHKAELAKYDTDTGTIRFPVGGTLPATLVRKLMRARMAETDKRSKR